MLIAATALAALLVAPAAAVAGSWQFLTQDPLVNSSPAMVRCRLYLSGTIVGTVSELYVLELVGD